MMPDYEPYMEADDDTEGINISPLIDIVFILLLFFVVTSVFIDESGLLIDKPKSSQAQSLESEAGTVVITANGELFVDNMPCNLNTLRSLVVPYRGRRVLIRADGAVTTQFLVRVMDEIKAAGIDEINLAADRKEP